MIVENSTLLNDRLYEVDINGVTHLARFIEKSIIGKPMFEIQFMGFAGLEEVSNIREISESQASVKYGY